MRFRHLTLALALYASQSAAQPATFSDPKVQFIQAVKTIADHQGAMDSGFVSGVLGTDFKEVPNSTNSRIQFCRKAYGAASDNFWFQERPGANTSVNVKPDFHYCENPSAIESVTDHAVMFDNITGYACISQAELKNILPEVGNHSSIAIAPPLVILDYPRHQGSAGAEFNFHGPCLTSVYIFQLAQNDARYWRAREEYNRCNYTVEDQFCSSEPAPPKDASETYWLDFNLRKSAFIGQKCMTVSDLYKKDSSAEQSAHISNKYLSQPSSCQKFKRPPEPL